MTACRSSLFLAASLGAGLAACSPRPPLVVGESSVADEASATLPAFVVYTRALQTVLVPLDPKERSVVREGLWLLGRDRLARVAEISADAPPPGGMLCAEGELRPSDHACDLPSLDPGERELVTAVEPLPERPPPATKEGDCTCYRDVGPTPTPAADDPPAPPATNPDGEPCTEAYDDRGVVSLVGGRLFSVGIGDDGGCHGPRTLVVDVDADDPLHEGHPLDLAGDVRCDEGLPPETYSAGWSGEACTEGPCCDFSPSATPIVVEDGGRLVVFDSHAADEATFQTRVTRVGLSAAKCPGPFDPCGTGEALPAGARAGEFWAASDESAALVLREGHFLLFRRGAPGQIREEPAPAVGVLGVRFHGDATALRDRLKGEVERSPKAAAP